MRKREKECGLSLCKRAKGECRRQMMPEITPRDWPKGRGCLQRPRGLQKIQNTPKVPKVPDKGTEKICNQREHQTTNMSKC